MFIYTYQLNVKNDALKKKENYTSPVSLDYTPSFSCQKQTAGLQILGERWDRQFTHQIIKSSKG